MCVKEGVLGAVMIVIVVVGVSTAGFCL